MASDEEEQEKHSRTREKTERVAQETALRQLAERLSRLSTTQLSRLELDEPLRDALADHRKIKSPAASARHLRLLRNLLRSHPWSALLRAVDALAAGQAPDQAATSEAAEWAVRLQISPDEGLSRFLERYPEADRQRLRTLARGIGRAPEGKRARLRQQLEGLVGAAIEASGGAAEPEDPWQ